MDGEDKAATGKDSDSGGGQARLGEGVPPWQDWWNTPPHCCQAEEKGQSENGTHPPFPSLEQQVEPVLDPVTGRISLGGEDAGTAVMTGAEPGSNSAHKGKESTPPQHQTKGRSR